MTVSLANLSSHEIFNEFRDGLLEFKLDEDFLRVVFLILKSRKSSPQLKICVLELISEKYENDIKLLHSQIQSYNFWDPKEFLENLPSPKQEEIVLPFDLQIEDDYSFKHKPKEIVSEFNIKNTTNQLVIKGLEAQIIHYAFDDPIANYMETIFSSSLQTSFYRWGSNILAISVTHHIFYYEDTWSSYASNFDDKQSNYPFISTTTWLASLEFLYYLIQ